MERCRKRLEEELSCSICLEYFNKPVTLDCGHMFCRACITNLWGETLTDAVCPHCKKRVQSKKLKLNKQLPNIVQIAKEMKNCGVSVERSVQDWKDRINSYLEILRKKKQNSLLYRIKDEKQSQDLIKQIQAEREKTRAAFRQHHQFLEFQEKLLLTQMDKVEKEITRRRDEHQASLPGKLSSLDSLIRELEEKRQQPDNEFLQNIENILMRCPKESESLETQTPFPIGLKWRVRDFYDINPLLQDLMTQFQDTLRSGLQLQKGNVSLDPDMTHPQVILSANLKSMRWTQNRPANLGVFDLWPIALGLQVFTSGRHFWEVTVGNEGKWCVAVARTSVRRHDKFDVFPTEDVWCLAMLDGKYYVGNDIPLHLTKMLKKIRVTLDCVGGRVAFFDADTGELLYVYPDAFLRGETLVPLFCVKDGGHLSICP